MDTQKAEKLKIIKFSQQKFFSEGFHKTTIDEIARQLAMSKNTIYKHFESKEQLVLAAIMDYTQTISTDVQAIVDSGEDAVHKFFFLMHFLSGKLVFLGDKMIHDLQIHAPHIWIKIDDMRKRIMLVRIGKMILQGKREELFLDYPTDLITAIFISSVRSILNPEFLINSKVSKEEAVTSTFQILLRGILTPKGLQILKNLKTPQ